MNISREYKDGDIDRIKQPKEKGEFTDEDMQVYVHYAETIEDDEVWAVMGIVRMWNGVGQGFVVTAEGYKGGISYTKATIRFIEKGMKELGLWRLQTYIDTNWSESKRFAELVGLDGECRLRKMSPLGHDLFMYARVIE